MRLLIDMDGVCCHTYQAVADWYNKEYGGGCILAEQKHFLISELCVKAPDGAVKAYFDSPGFFRNLPVRKGCPEVLYRLHKRGHDIVFVTHVPKQSVTGLYEKREWLQEHLPFISPRNIIAAQRKELVSGDLLLDDGPENIISFPGITCVFDAPYNREVAGTHRIYTWFEFENIVKRIGVRI